LEKWYRLVGYVVSGYNICYNAAALGGAGLPVEKPFKDPTCRLFLVMFDGIVEDGG